MSDTDLMTAAEVADRLKISAETVRAWCRRGRIPGHRYSHKVLRFRLGEVVAALEAARQGIARGATVVENTPPALRDESAPSMTWSEPYVNTSTHPHPRRGRGPGDSRVLIG